MPLWVSNCLAIRPPPSHLSSLAATAFTGLVCRTVYSLEELSKQTKFPEDNCVSESTEEKSNKRGTSKRKSSVNVAELGELYLLASFFIYPQGVFFPHQLFPSLFPCFWLSRISNYYTFRPDWPSQNSWASWISYSQAALWGARGREVAGIGDAVLSSSLLSFCSCSHFPAIVLILILIHFIITVVIFCFIVNRRVSLPSNKRSNSIMHPSRYMHAVWIRNPKKWQISYDPLSGLTMLEEPLHRFMIDLVGITRAHEHVLQAVGRGNSHFIAVAIAGLFLLCFLTVLMIPLPRSVSFFRCFTIISMLAKPWHSLGGEGRIKRKKKIREDLAFLFTQVALVKRHPDLLLQVAFRFGEQGLLNFNVVGDVVEAVRVVSCLSFQPTTSHNS